MNSLENFARICMLRSQVATGHVLSPRVLEALGSIPREQFVPDAFMGAAYVDDEIAVANNRFLMEPLTFARFLEYASVMPTDTVLDVGVGLGYSAAVLSQLAGKVVALEEDNSLAQKAKSNLHTYSNITLVTGSLTEGVSKESPFDIILIEGAVEMIPQKLIDQLCEGGRLLVVEHDTNAKTALAGLGKLVSYQKLRAAMFKTIHCDASVPLLMSFARATAFVL